MNLLLSNTILKLSTGSGLGLSGAFLSVNHKYLQGWKISKA